MIDGNRLHRTLVLDQVGDRQYISQTPPIRIHPYACFLSECLEYSAVYWALPVSAQS